MRPDDLDSRVVRITLEAISEDVGDVQRQR
jgi:hypothetical protein